MRLCGDECQVDISPQVFRIYAFYASILVFKMIFMSLLTVGQRLRKRVVQNDEDSKFFNIRMAEENDQELERIKRAHLDDLETILPFFTLGILFCFTHPSPANTNFLFKTFTVARFVHSFVYAIYIIRQPVRAFAWSIATVINCYMGFKILFYYL